MIAFINCDMGEALHPDQCAGGVAGKDEKAAT